MLDEKKIKLMTRMALYEQTQGASDLKVSAYYRKDYVSIHRLYAFFWVTLGYVGLVALVFLGGFDFWMEKMSVQSMIFLGIVAVVGYLAALIGYLVTASFIYDRKHQDARMRVKKYNHDLTRLLKIYEKEKK